MKLVCPSCYLSYVRQTKVHEGFRSSVLTSVRCPRCRTVDVFEYKVEDNVICILEERSERVLQLREKVGLAP